MLIGKRVGGTSGRFGAIPVYSATAIIARKVEQLMNAFWMILLTLLALLLAIYAQLRIPRFTAGRQAIILTRAILIVVGIAFGYVAAASYADDRFLTLLAFLIGFGAVHVPAAFILFIKKERREGKS